MQQVQPFGPAVLAKENWEHRGSGPRQNPICAIELLISYWPEDRLRPGEECNPLRGRASGSPTSHPENQGGGRRKRRPRSRPCLLKGCEQHFRPRHARQRYCSEPCRKAARAWSRWKTQKRYRSTATGKQQRNGQSRRYRKRVRDRKPPADEGVPDAARV